MKHSSDAQHWDSIYRKYHREQLGWYAPVLTTSLDWITALAPGTHAGILDVGGGSSTLVDQLLQRGYSDTTVVDMSDEALKQVETRLARSSGSATSKVQLVRANILDSNLMLQPIDVWHDRAAFHFLTDDRDIVAYQRLAASLVRPGGTLILGVFTPNAPPTCSGLPVNRHTTEGLEVIWSTTFLLLKTSIEMHVTPGGVNQEYLYTAWQRRSDANIPDP